MKPSFTQTDDIEYEQGTQWDHDNELLKLGIHIWCGRVVYVVNRPFEKRKRLRLTIWNVFLTWNYLVRDLES